MKQQNERKKYDYHPRIMALDKLFMWMSSGYGLLWLVSLPFFRQYWEDSSHGGFFDHIGFVTFVYAGTSICTYLAKHQERFSWFAILSYFGLGLFFAYPLLGIYGATLVGFSMALMATKKTWNTTFVTGALLGYWALALVISLVEYNPLLQLGGGFGAVFFELFSAVFNMTNHQVYRINLTWLIFVPIGMGYFVTKRWSETNESKMEQPKYEEEPIPKEEQKEQLQPEETNETPVPTVHVDLGKQPSSENKTKPTEPNTRKSVNKTRSKRNEKPSKSFFTEHKPKHIKWKKWWENKIRQLSK